MELSIAFASHGAGHRVLHGSAMQMGVEPSMDLDIHGVVMADKSPTTFFSRRAGYGFIYGPVKEIVVESSTDPNASGAICSCQVVCSI